MAAPVAPPTPVTKQTLLVMDASSRSKRRRPRARKRRFVSQRRGNGGQRRRGRRAIEFGVPPRCIFERDDGADGGDVYRSGADWAVRLRCHVQGLQAPDHLLAISLEQ